MVDGEDRGGKSGGALVSAGGPLVSVILPTRDRALTLKRAIESVLGQTYGARELIVVDDGSTDDTMRVLERFGEQITVLTQPPAGPYAARNLALDHAQGDLVAFIDSDDAWHPDRLASQLPLLARAQVGLVFGDVRHVGGRTRTSFAVTPPRRGRVADHFATGNFVPTISVLARRSCLAEAGGFPTSHAVSADYLMWFRIATRHELDFVPRPIADYTVHAGGVSSDLGPALLARLELFTAELERTSDPALRTILERLVFNLGMHLALAVMRGRARSVPHAWARARRALAIGPPAAGLAFAGDHARRRVRRLAA
jgi:glycosyltransferase involved in cell wall biosynthesis